MKYKQMVFCFAAFFLSACLSSSGAGMVLPTPTATTTLAPTHTPTSTPSSTKDPYESTKELISIETQGLISFENNQMVYELNGRTVFLEQISFSDNDTLLLDMGELGVFEFGVNDIDIEDGVLRIDGFRFNGETGTFEIRDFPEFVTAGMISQSVNKFFEANGEIPACKIEESTLKDLWRFLKHKMTSQFDRSTLKALPLGMIGSGLPGGLIFMENGDPIGAYTDRNQVPIHTIGYCAFTDSLGRNYSVVGLEIVHPDKTKTRPEDNIVVIGFDPNYVVNPDMKNFGKNLPSVSIKQSLQESKRTAYPIIFITGDFGGYALEGIEPFVKDPVTLDLLNRLLNEGYTVTSILEGLEGRFVVVSIEDSGVNALH